jgi:YHS domain-containing protein
VSVRHLGIDVGGTSCKLAVLETAGTSPDRPGDHPRGPPDPPGRPGDHPGGPPDPPGPDRLAPAPAEAVDPVCGMTVAVAGAPTAVRDGVTWYFCSVACRDHFERTGGP